MQANANSGNTTSPQLLVEVQFGEHQTASNSYAGYDFDGSARQVFALALAKGYASDFMQNAGAVSDVELCIRLVDSAEGAELNGEWRGKPAPTNILSFTADIVAGHFAQLGDLVICSPVVVREAAEQQKTEANHLTHLLVHGVLHLLGYDHVDETEAEVMEAMEVVMLDELGVSNPYE